MRLHTATLAVALAMTNAGTGLLGASRAGAQTTPRIPLVEGLTLVGAGQMKTGDTESIKRVVSVTDADVRFRYSGRLMRPDGIPARVDVMRRVRRSDLRQGRRIKISYSTVDDEVELGATALTVSARVFDDLRQGRPTTFWVIDATNGGLDVLLEMRLPVSDFKGTLTRVGTGTVPMPVLLQGERVSLPTIHARGRFGEGDNAKDGEFWILDDPENPLVLKLSFGTGRGQIVRIDYPAERTLETALSKRDTAVVYGIHFEFASAALRPESESTVAEIVAVMNRHPDWTLRVAGHTDDIGGPASNLELSRRRADAVKAALVAQGIAASRLETAGYGASSPKEPNTTLEGRARNRRVELTRK